MNRALRWGIILLIVQAPSNAFLGTLALPQTIDKAKEARNTLKTRKLKFDERLFLEFVKKGDIETSRLYLTAGMSANTKDKENRTALMWAVLTNHPDMVQTLLEFGASIQARDRNGKTAFMLALEQDNAEIIKVFLNSGFDVNSITDYGLPILSHAINRGNLATVRALLESDVDPNVPGGPFARSPLIFACLNKDSHSALLLIDKGADVTQADKNGRTPLHEAARYGLIDVIKALLDKGADVNAADQKGRTPLMESVLSGLVKTTTILIENKAQVNLQDKQGNTALILLAEAPGNWVELAGLLLKAGAKLNIRNNKGLTALRTANLRGRVELVRFLQYEGAKY